MSFAESFALGYCRRLRIEDAQVFRCGANGHMHIQHGDKPPAVLDPHEGRSWYLNREQHARDLERRLDLYFDDGASWRPWSLL
jgi:hypothetical protein